ncbi:MAG: hypothetical protein ACLFQV_12025 [Vulcanimicrobiota bacterium]
MNKKFFIFLGLLLIFFSSTSRAENDYKVIPAERLGEYKFKENFATYSKKIGEPAKTYHIADEIGKYYEEQKLYSVYNKDTDIIRKILTFDSRYSLDGITVDDTNDKIKETFGFPNGTIYNKRFIEDERNFYKESVMFLVEIKDIKALGVLFEKD